MSDANNNKGASSDGHDVPAEAAPSLETLSPALKQQASALASFAKVLRQQRQAQQDEAQGACPDDAA